MPYLPFRIIAANAAIMALCLPANADCVASAELLHEPAMNTRGQVILHLKVDTESCDKQCYGLMTVRLSYLNSASKAHAYDISIPWSAQPDRSTRVRKKLYRDSCDNNSTGPCQLQSVDIVGVSCFNEEKEVL